MAETTTDQMSLGLMGAALTALDIEFEAIDDRTLEATFAATGGPYRLTATVPESGNSFRLEMTRQMTIGVNQLSWARKKANEHNRQMDFAVAILEPWPYGRKGTQLYKTRALYPTGPGCTLMQLATWTTIFIQQSRYIFDDLQGLTRTYT